MATEAEIAWAAGLFEGEGCISYSEYAIKDGSIRYACTLDVTSSDFDILERFKEIVGCGYIKLDYPAGVPKPHYKVVYYWKTGRREQVFEILNLLLPWFGDRRKTKALDVLEKVTEMLVTGREPAGEWSWR